MTDVKLVPTSVTEAKMIQIVERSVARGVEKQLARILSELQEIKALLEKPEEKVDKRKRVDSN